MKQQQQQRQRQQTPQWLPSLNNSVVFAIAVVLLVCFGGVQQTKLVSTVRLTSRETIRIVEQRHIDGRAFARNSTVKNSFNASTLPFLPPKQLPMQQSKVRRESRNITNQRQSQSRNNNSKNNNQKKRPRRRPVNTTKAFRRLPPETNSTRQIMYIHIGKTGGYTLDAALVSNCAWYGLVEPRKACFDNFFHAQQKNVTWSSSILEVDSVLSYLTKATVHLAPRFHYDNFINTTTTFLFSIRNPISRAVSAFDMDHLLNNDYSGRKHIRRSVTQFYEKCFPTAEHLAQVLMMKKKNQTTTIVHGDNSTISGSSGGNVTTPAKFQRRRSNRRIQQEPPDCRTLGWNILRGTHKGSPITHLKFNYNSYMNFTLDAFPDMEVMVVRTEHLWDDVANLDTFLGGTGKFVKAGHQFDHGREKYLVKSKLSKDGKQEFCRALQDEIVIYRMLIDKAINLNTTEKEATLDVLREDCGDAWVD
ncbi:MAG: hypothetical protein SGILL_006063 [Bacillariaceae sp.]